MPRIESGYRENFNTLLRAAGNNDLALVDCRDRATGRPVRVICAMQPEDDGDINREKKLEEQREP